MAKVYVLSEKGESTEMNGIRCQNEDLELQRILELNPDLVPGDQINPDNPRRWLVVKREMPVPDPGTGSDRWSIDMFFVDQDAMPTFIECKRYNDTGARRKVVGQMLEYAANGHHYWTKEEMRTYAERFAENSGSNLEDDLMRLQHEGFSSVDDFFQQVQDNLRGGQIRLVFFMEEGPAELKSVVDFLNKQMERSEVLLVEARQYELDGKKIVTPILFGFTEEARQIKKTTTTTQRAKKRWDRESFIADARVKLSLEEVDAIEKLLDKSLEIGSEVRWRVGNDFGSYSVQLPNLINSSLFTVNSDGIFVINFGHAGEEENQQKVIAFLKDSLRTDFGINVPENSKYFKTTELLGKVDEFIVLIESLLAQHSVN